MNSVVKALRGTSDKSVQVFQMQFVGLLLVLLVILGSKLNQPVEKEIKTIPRQFLVSNNAPFSEMVLGEVVHGVVVLSPQKLESLSYLLKHHDLKAHVLLGTQATMPETFSVGDKLLKSLSEAGIESKSLSIRISPEKVGAEISVALEKFETVEAVL